MPVAAYYLHDPAAPRPNSPTRMGTNVLLECRGRLLLEQRWDCGAWGLPGGRLRRGESEAHGIARELFEETGLRLPEAAFTRVRVVDDADRIASYQDGTVWRMVMSCSARSFRRSRSCTAAGSPARCAFLRRRSCARRT